VVSKYTGHRLDYKQVLNDIDQLAVWQAVLGLYGIVPYQKICNTLRGDNRPNTWLSEYRGNLVLTDFAYSQFNGMNILSAIMYKYGVNFPQALEQCMLMQFGNSDSPIKHERIKIKAKSNITYSVRPFNKSDAEFWKSRGITHENLVSDNVQALSGFTIGNTSYVACTNAYVYGFPSGHFKIYQPYSYTKELKWFGNSNKDDYWFIDNFLADDLVLTKGYKEARIIANLTDYATASLNGEGYKVLPEELLRQISWYRQIKVLYDNDKAGRNGAKIITDIINSYYPDKAITLEYPEIKEKDIDLYRVNHGETQTKLLLNEILG